MSLTSSSAAGKPRLGFHVSIAGGIALAVERARARKCTVVQIFSRSPRAWRCTELDPQQAQEFHAGIQRWDIRPVVVHTQYLLNLASPERWLFRRSWQALRVEMQRADAVGADFVVTHIGHSQSPVAACAKRVAEALARALEDAPGAVRLLMENSAGKEGAFGSRIHHLGLVLQACARLGLPSGLVVGCFDTAHAYASGYDLSREEGLAEAAKEWDAEIGSERVLLVHANDTRSALGSGVDRHWHLGQGNIGTGGFRRLAHHPWLGVLPMIMETPGTVEDDLRNMRALRRAFR